MTLAQTIVLAVAVLSFVLGIVYFLVTLLGRQISDLGVSLTKQITDQGAALSARLDRVDVRLDRVEAGLTDLRVDVAKIGPQLDAHVVDPRAHTSA